MRSARRELEVLTPLDDEELGASVPSPSPPVFGPAGPAGPAGLPGATGAAAPVVRRRWPVVTVVVVIVAVAVALPVRDGLARRELGWLDRQWAQAIADDGGRITAEQQLTAFSEVADPAQVTAALAAVYQEEQERVAATRDRVAGVVLVAPRLSTLRGIIAAALDHRAALLGQVAAWYRHPTGGTRPASADAQTAADAIRVDQTLQAERSHWHVAKPAPTPRATPLVSATAALAHLSRWLDQPTGAVLLSGSGSGDQLVRLEVDASRVVPTGIPAVEGYATMRPGYLAYASGDKIWAVAADGSGAPRLLATGSYVFGAADPSAVWVVDGVSLKATEIDGSGRVLVGPVQPPGNLFLDTAAGLLVSRADRPGIWVWNPVDGSLRCPNLLSAGDGGPFALAASGNDVAWASGDGQLHLTDVSTCADRLPGIGDVVAGNGIGGVATFSPDGRTLAIAVYGTISQTPTTFVDVIDVASGRVTMVPGSPVLWGPLSTIAWTPNGARLFWVYSRTFTGSAYIETWRVSDPMVATPLRAVGLSLTFPLYVIP